MQFTQTSSLKSQMQCLENELSLRLYHVFGEGGLHRVACGILVPWPRIEPRPLKVEACSLDHWNAREALLSHSWLHFFPDGPGGGQGCDAHRKRLKPTCLRVNNEFMGASGFDSSRVENILPGIVFSHVFT